MNRLWVNNSGKYRLIRTIIQGIIGVLIANLDVIIGVFHFTPEIKVIIVALVMAILSPIMAFMGDDAVPDKGELPYNYWEEGGEDDGDA